MSHFATKTVTDDWTLTETEYHTLLADSRRRLILGLLADGHEWLELDELAAAIAEHEGGGQPVRQIKAQLHHHHLPKMADIGVLTYEHAEGRIESAELLATMDLPTRLSP